MKTSARIEVHPSVMFKLGEDLITDEVQALAELVKNAYDAELPKRHRSDRDYRRA